MGAGSSAGEAERAGAWKALAEAAIQRGAKLARTGGVGRTAEEPARQPADEAAKAREAEAPKAGEGVADAATGVTMGMAAAGRAPMSPRAKGQLQKRARRAEVHTVSSSESPKTQGKEAAEAEMASTAEGLAVSVPVAPGAREALGLVRARDDPHAWGNTCVTWQDRANPEGRSVFVLDNFEEAGEWTAFLEYGRLAQKSLRTAANIIA